MKLRYVTTQVPISLHKAVKKAAKERGVLLAAAYRVALENWLKQQDQQDKAAA